MSQSQNVSGKSRKRLIEGEMVGLRWALRRIGQQGILNSRRGLSKRESRLQLVTREYSSAGRGIGVWGACFDGGQPHQVLLTFQKVKNLTPLSYNSLFFAVSVFLPRSLLISLSPSL